MRPNRGVRALSVLALAAAGVWIWVTLPVLEGLARLSARAGLYGSLLGAVLVLAGLVLAVLLFARRPVLLLWAASLALVLAAFVHLRRDRIVGLFGPAVVEMTEIFPRLPDGPRFDHAALDAVLARFVDAEGCVDYAGLAAAPADLDRYVASLAEAPLDALGRDEKLALLVNAYNAFTLRLILDHWPLDSILDIPPARRWDDRRWRVGPHVLSLSDLEHDWLRRRFVEPRIHFAINCASVACPPLARRAYAGDRIDADLETQARRLHADGRWVAYDPQADRLRLTRIYSWYAGDFEQVAESVPAYVARYAGPLRAALAMGREPTIDWLEYDWGLNAAGK